MKKIMLAVISIVLVLAIAFPSTAFSSYYNCKEIKAYDEQSSIIDNCYNIAESVVTKYYIAQQTSTKVNFEKSFFYPALNEYLQLSLSNSYSLAEDSAINEIGNDLIAESIEVKCRLYDYKINVDTVEVDVIAEITVKYPQMNDFSCFTNTVNCLFVYDDNSYKIADIVFDNKLDIKENRLDASKWDLSKNESSIKEIMHTTKEKNENFKHNILNFKDYVIALNVAPIERQDSNRLSASSSLTIKTFNKTKMVSYAKKTARLVTSSNNKLYNTDGTSARGSSEAPYYYDFNSFQGSYDCTNFISHCLLAGGAKMNQNGSPSTGWYFNNVNAPSSTSRSYTWSSVTRLGDMLISNTGKGPRGNQVNYYGNGLVLGDIIQFQYSDYAVGSYGHSAIITKDFYADFLSEYSSEIGPIINCGITSRSFRSGGTVNQNFYRKILNLDGGNVVVGYRCIHLTNYAY